MLGANISISHTTFRVVPNSTEPDPLHKTFYTSNDFDSLMWNVVYHMKNVIYDVPFPGGKAAEA
jgi:hypothetical protein